MRTVCRSVRSLLLLAVAWGASGAVSGDPVLAQTPERLPQAGTARAGLLLRQLDGNKRVLMIGAHPDDEETSFLASQALGSGARTAYLSLNRGEGGQNLIGPELDEGLGLIRTGELVSARSLDGAEQFFTRTYDFGFTKTARETLELWGEEDVLREVVRRVRAFRPHIIVSVFSGTPRDGHGQHQVAGMVAREAFRVAGDPAAFPEQGEEGLDPWSPAKLYRLTYRDPQAATLQVPTGVFDPLLGRSHHQVARASRSRHRSQDMGTAQPMGPQNSRLLLLESRVDSGPSEDGLWAGIDTTLVGLVRREGSAMGAGVAEMAGAVEGFRVAVAEARSRLHALDPSPAAAPLATALRSVREILSGLEAAGLSGSEAHQAFLRREALVQEALLSVAAVQLEVRSGDDLVVPGEVVELEGELWNGGPFALSDVRGALVRPADWGVLFQRDGSSGQGLEPGRVARWTGEVVLPETAEPSVPYFLRAPREGFRYVWPVSEADGPWGGDGLLAGLDPGTPGNPPVLTGRAEFTLQVPESGGFGGPVEVSASSAVRYRGVDKSMGQFFQPLLVVPALSLAPRPRQMAWPADRAEPREVEIRVSSNAEDPVSARVRLQVPTGWRARPESHDVAFDGPDQEQILTFSLQPPAGVTPGQYEIGVRAESPDGRVWDRRIEPLDYPHIERTLLPSPARIGVSVFPVQVAQRRVGYIMGSGDDGPEALRQLGLEVVELGPDRVAAGDYGGLDVLVLGVRAYETRPELAAANDAVLAFARSGGVVVVQYNKYEFPAGGYAPYPLSMSRPHDRVTDESAPVTLLEPGAPVFTAPNRIGEEDFLGWTQERGLYFLSDWDPRYRPLLSMADPEEEPKEGALVVTPLGEGLWVYTGLAFFRQFPAGVPGAYRLFANLVSLDPGAWREGW